MTGLRRLGWLLAGLLLLLVLLLAAVWGVLNSQAGSRWLLGKVPGLEMQAFRGALLGSWQADRLLWQDGSTRVELTETDMALDTGCLLRRSLCLSHLRVNTLDLQLPPSGDTDDEPRADIELPDINLPLSVDIGELRLGELRLDGEPLLHDLHLAVRAAGNRVDLQQLALGYEDYSAQLAGWLQLDQNWPLELKLQAGGPVPDLGQQAIQLQLGGTLQQQLELDGSLQGRIGGQLSGRASVLQVALPASLQLQLERLQLDGLLPEGLAVDNLQLAADGSLEQGFAWQLNSALKAAGEAFALNSKGEADTATAQIDHLQLAHSKQGSVQLSGKAGWQDGISATADLNISQFPWHHFAALDEAPVAIRDAALTLVYENDRYQGDIKAALSGPAGDFNLDTQLQGDAGSVQVEPLLVTAGSGRIQGRVQAGWQDTVHWLAELDIDKLDPAYWVADFPGLIEGRLQTKGSIEQALQLEADLKLGGSLRGQPLQAVVLAQGQGEHWKLPQLDLRLGDNRIQGELSLDSKLAGQLQLALNQPAQLLPELAGQLTGNIGLGGSLQQPDLDIQLDGTQLAMGELGLKTLQLQGQLRQGSKGQMELTADGLANAGEALGQLQLKADGDLDAHRLQADFKGPLANAGLQLAGRLDADKLHWQGQLQTLSAVVENQHWQLEQPMTVDYLHAHYARLGAHCLASEHGKLCGEGQQQVLPALKLDYALRQFALPSLATWLPPELALEGQLNGRFKISEQPVGLQGQVELDAGQGALLLVEEQQRFAWRGLNVTADLKPAAVDARVKLQGQDQGLLELQASLDPRPDNKPLKGSFSIRDLDLGILRAFVEDIEHLKGRIEGQGTVSGTLLEPRVDGDIRLIDGHVGGGMVPTELEQLQVAIKIAGQQAHIDGGWRSGSQGQARLGGDVSWAGAPNARITLKGSQLPVFVVPYADIVLEPDLKVDYNEQGLAVEGVVKVPSGTITVPELPPSAVGLSGDTVIAGSEEPENPMNLRMNVTIDVGSERLKFSGFGLTSDVRGNLSVRDNLAGRGVLELKDGRFRGFGQKLDLRKARLVFSGPLTQPYIDLEAVRVTGDVTAGMRVKGLAEQPQTEIFSEPVMPQEQAMSWLLLGKPLGGGDDGNMMAEAALAMGLMGAAPLAQKYAESMGLKDFQLESEGSGTQTSVVASSKITDRLSVRYGVGIFEPGNTIGLRYQLTQRLYLDAASGLANSLDLFYRKNF